MYEYGLYFRPSFCLFAFLDRPNKLKLFILFKTFFVKFQQNNKKKALPGEKNFFVRV